VSTSESSRSNLSSSIYWSSRDLIYLWNTRHDMVISFHVDEEKWVNLKKKQGVSNLKRKKLKKIDIFDNAARGVL
jgi:hypothetical protein